MADSFTQLDATTMTHGMAVNGASPYNGLTLKQLLGLEILLSFQRKQVVSNQVLIKNIKGGQMGQFPIMGRAQGQYHQTGQRVATTGIKYAERTITVNRPYIASTFCDNFEEAIAHFDSRAERADALAEQLAYVQELHTMMMLANASHATKVITDADQVNGSWLANDQFKVASGGAASVEAQAAALAEALYKANVLMDNAFVPRDGRKMVLRPDEYSVLAHAVQSSGFSVVNTLYGGKGSIAEGTCPRLDGTDLLSTPLVPKRVYTSAENDFTYYNGDYSKLIGLVFRREAVGKVQLWEASVESEYQIEYQGNLILAKQAYGLGVLRPECCVALELSTLSNS